MRPGPGLVVMVLAFFTGARPTSTFSSRDYDRRLLLLSTLSQPSSPPPSTTTPTSTSSPTSPSSSSSPSTPLYKNFFYPYDYRSTSSSSSRSKDTDTVSRAGASLDRRVERNADHPLTHDNDDDAATTDDQEQASQRTYKSSLSRPDSGVAGTGPGYHRTRVRSSSASPQSPNLFSEYFRYQHNKATPQPIINAEPENQQQQPQEQQQQQLQHQLKQHIRTDEYSATDGGGAPLVAASQVKVPHDEQGITGGALARINPWLSACDLAQSSSAPDLQGQCTAGKLPVAWVDEGPGPPVCPESCGTFKEQSNYEKLFNLNVVNSPSMDNNSTISGDSHNSRDNRKSNKRGRGDMCDDIRNRLPGSLAGRSASIKAASVDREENALLMGSTTTTTTSSSATSVRTRPKSESDQKIVPCLDSLGDARDTQPKYICSRRDNIKRELQRIRLRHCCERDLYTALHGHALEEVLKGGEKCVEHLTDLMQTDALATRITCEFTEILVRYDCRQMYSIIHHCEDCKEAYRRWVCSTLIPYFDYAERYRQPQNKNTEQSTSPTNVLRRSIPETSSLGTKMTIVDNSSATKKKRSRRKSNPEKIRTRIRPCLSVCQTVEQKCPYLLPGDRAPAHPTQYAGEPTFLCLDPNIPETGDQKVNSNHGPNECCYDYCGNGSGRKLCGRCKFNVTVPQVNGNLSDMEMDEDHASPYMGTEIEAEASPEYYRDDSYPSELMHCSAIHVPATLGISTVRMSVLPNTRCPIPYYIGSENHPHPDSGSRVVGGAKSSAMLHRPSWPLYIVLVSVLAVSMATFPASQICCWLLFDSPLRIKKLLLLLWVLAVNRKCRCGGGWWQWQWWWWLWKDTLRMSTSVLLNSSLVSSITRCWRTQLFRRVIMQIRTLKCQLLLFWELNLIRNYLQSPHRRYCCHHYRRCCCCSTSTLPRDPVSLLIRVANKEADVVREEAQNRQPTSRPPPSPPPQLPTAAAAAPPPLPRPVSISSQSSLREKACAARSQTEDHPGSGGRRSNNNAKTVVRWGTIVLACRLGYTVCDQRSTTDFRITNYCRPGRRMKSFLRLLVAQTNINIISTIITMIKRRAVRFGLEMVRLLRLRPDIFGTVVVHCGQGSGSGQRCGTRLSCTNRAAVWDASGRQLLMESKWSVGHGYRLGLITRLET